MRIVTSHKNTDFDSLASMIAATLLYPDAIVALPDSINPNVNSFLSIHKDMFNVIPIKQVNPDDIKSLIIVDAGSWERLQFKSSFYRRNDIEIILWDHHLLKGNINATWQCVEKKGATITLLLRHLIKQNKPVSSIQATLFLIGLYEDTGNLAFPSTTAEDAYAAGFLLENNADLNVLGTFIRPAYSQKQKDLLFEMLKTSERIKVNAHNISINRQSINGHVTGLAVIVNMYREILNVDSAFGIFTDKKGDKSIVIGRSHSDALNMGAIMKTLGGGGHSKAGSAMLKSVNPIAVENMIIDLIKGNQASSIQIGDIMSFPVISVSEETTMRQVSLILREKGCTGIPVLKSDKVVGIISRRDFSKIQRKNQMDMPVKAFMSTNVKTIGPATSIVHATHLLVKHDIGRLPVVENGKLIGIVTRTDAMHYYYDLLPE